MASDSKKSNQAAGEGSHSCRHAGATIAAFWAARLEVPENAVWSVALAIQSLQRFGSLVQRVLEGAPCDCGLCSRRPRRRDDKNPHEGKVML